MSARFTPRSSLLGALPRFLLAAPVAPAVLALLAGCGTTADHQAGGTSSGPSSTSSSSGTPPLAVDDIMSDLPQSCSFQCSACPEPDTAYVCPTMAAWDTLPHADTCGAWDGTYPAVVKGRCTASEPTGDAIAKAGPIPGGLILPDGRRLKPAGHEHVFAEADLVGGFPMSVTALAGTHYALVSDGGIDDNALRLVNVDGLATGVAPVPSYVRFPAPSSLFYGIAFLPPGRALASGGGDAVIYAFDVDTTAGKLARAATRDIQLGKVANKPYYAGAVATSKDMTRLFVAPSDNVQEIRIYSLADADYGKQVGAVPVGTPYVFDLRLDPFDPSGTTLYATDQGNSRLLEIDGANAKLTRTVPLGKNPEQIVFLDATYLAIAESDSDELAIVDRTTGVVAAHVPVFAKGEPPGSSPTALTYDAANKRLYAVLAGANAVEAFDVGAGSPPTIAPAGRIPTAWWPTGVALADDGSLVITNGKGHGTGTDDKEYTWGNGTITSRMHGSVQRVPPDQLTDLGASTAVADANDHLAELTGRSEPTCPAGADDFPIPKDDASGPSKQIKHVILIVRENKTYDAVFGDRKDLGDGDPSLIMASDTDLQSQIWVNARAIATQFTNFDNFYTDAEQSIQGHTWTVYGRTTDYMERSWLSIWGRGSRVVATPTLEIDTPLEGGIFAWMDDNKIPIDNMGEIVGRAAPDQRYPGLFYAQSRPDVDKACYVAGRVRLQCDLKPFTYALQTNDHTYGGAVGSPAPEVMIAVNDEATGMLLDGLSRSPIWKDSLLLVTEDDPQDGGDHVDLHRSILLMASPWIRRGYVSHGHYDMASVYKLVAHIFGIPYHNDTIANALVPFDAFTSTPDYTPYTYTPRSVSAPCNPSGTKHAKAASGWNFRELDDQPGLSEELMDMMKEPREARGIRVSQPKRAPR